MTKIFTSLKLAAVITFVVLDIVAAPVSVVTPRRPSTASYNFGLTNYPQAVTSRYPIDSIYIVARIITYRSLSYYR